MGKVSSQHQKTQPQPALTSPAARQVGVVPAPDVRQDAPAPLRRAGGVLRRVMFYLSLPMALLCALWITAGRLLLGAGGDLVPIFAVSFGPALLGILVVAWVYSAQELKLQKRGVAAGLPPVTTLVLSGTWVMALIFGIFVPDRLEGQNVSAFAALLGPQAMGISAAFGNTTGILTFSLAIATLLLAISDYRTAKALTGGLDAHTREELERQESMYDFLD